MQRIEMGKNKLNKKNLEPSNRQLRVGELIRRNLSDIISRGELHEVELDKVSITVSEVRCSADLKIATIFVIPLGGNNTEEVVHSLSKNRVKLRMLLAKNINLKFVPDLRFLGDTSFDRMDHTQLLLNDPIVQRDIQSEDIEPNNHNSPKKGEISGA